MATPGYQPNATPGYRPPQPPRYRRSIAGPCLLILIGCIFLAQQLGMHISFFELFARYWPLLLIFVGVIKLIEFVAGYYFDSGDSRLGGGTVTLLILVCLVGGGMSWTYHHRDQINWSDMQVDDDFLSLFGSRRNYDQQAQQGLPDGCSVKIVNQRGDVSVIPTDEAQIRVVAHKSIFAGSDSEADNVNQQTAPRITQMGSVLLVTLPPTQDSFRLKSDIEVYLPRKASVEVENRRGDVKINSEGVNGDLLGQVKIAIERGTATVESVKGDVYVNLQRSTLRADKLGGGLYANGAVDNVTVGEVAGLVRLDGEYGGDVNLNSLPGGVRFHSTASTINIAALAGEMSVSGGDLRIDDAKGPVDIETPRSKNINLRGVAGPLKIDNNAGDITIEASAPGSMDIYGRHGSVRLQLPAKGAFAYEARTRGGEIRSDFDGMKINNPDHGAASASGAIGHGGPTIRVTSDKGDISFDKLD